MNEAINLALRESKTLEKRDKPEEALRRIEEAVRDLDQLDCPLRGKVAVRIGSLCNVLAENSAERSLYLLKAEQILGNFTTFCKNGRNSVPAEVRKIYAVTLNNLAVSHQEQKNYHNSMSYLMKSMKTLNESATRDIDFSR